MTRFNTWIAIGADGSVHSGPWSDSPRKHLADEGAILILGRASGCESGLVVLVPSSEGRIEWLADVSVGVQSGGVIRRIAGPGIRSPNPVRTWVLGRGPVFVSDGPVEGIHLAQDRIDRALRRAAVEV